jgi:hypothetical protein
MHGAKFKGTRAPVAGEVNIWTKERLLMGEDPLSLFTRGKRPFQVPSAVYWLRVSSDLAGESRRQ